MSSQSRSSESSNRDGWLLVDMMGDEPTVVFEDARTKSFARLDRRKQVHPASSITDQIRTVVDRYKSGVTREPITETWQVGSEQGVLAAYPVLGPPADPAVYGALVWVGECAPPMPLRTVGTMMWDPANQTTYHSHVTETEILRNPEIRYERTSPEVFRHFQDYPREHILGPWVQGVSDGDQTIADTFDDEIELKRTDGELIRIYLTMRGVELDDGRRIRGLIHDLSDLRPPTGEVGYSRRTARAVAQVLKRLHINCGVADINFATGIILEWLVPPPAPLDAWATENAVWDDMDALMAQIKKVADGSPEVTFDAKVSFASQGDTPIAVRVMLSPATAGIEGTGIIQVQPLADIPDDEGPGSLPMAW